MAEITIGEYLFLRLKELGVGTIFGVPGGNAPLNQRPKLSAKQPNLTWTVTM